jgi:hypothetical protein
MNNASEIKINKIELVNVPDDVFNEFLKELSKTHEHYILDDGFYVKLLKLNYDTLRKLNIDTRKLKIIEKRYKTTQKPATTPEYLSNILLLESKKAEPVKNNLTKKIYEKAINYKVTCITCQNAILTKSGVNCLSKMTWMQDVCLKCKDYSNYKLK